MMRKITWLPMKRVCSCPIESLNCLPPHQWYNHQSPIWRFAKKDVYAEFERYSRKVHPAIFPRVLARRIIETYTHEGEAVLDLFCGVGTTLVSAVELDRSAVGFELNPHYVRVTRRRMAYMNNIKSRRSNVRAVVFNTDARQVDNYIPKDSIDLILTSPPYWDLLKQPPSLRNKLKGKYLKKNYSDDLSDMSNLPTLNEFIFEMTSVFRKANSVLKPGGRMVIITGDYRRQGDFIPLHAIYINRLEQIGLELNNIIFWDRTSEYDTGLYSYPYHFKTVNGMVEYVLEFIKR